VKPSAFAYYAPESVDEVSRLLAELGDEAKVLAGGQSLVPLLNMRLTRFEALIDVRRVEPLRRIERANGELVVGAMVRQCDVEESAEIRDAVPLLALATPYIGHFQIRSRGTVGGSIAHADPAAEYPAVALALDAQLEVTGPAGSRSIAATDFFTGTWTTALEPDEVLVATRFPVWDAGSAFAVDEVARRHGDFAIAGAMVGVHVGNGAVDRAAIALFGVGSTPVRATEAEAALIGTRAADVDPVEIARLTTADLDPPADLHASGALRRRVGAGAVRRALGRALEEARVG